MVRKHCCARPRRCLCTMVLLAVVSYLLWHFLGRPSADEVSDFISDFDFGDFTDVLANLTDTDWMDGFNEDPYIGDDNIHSWQTDGYGLTLELQNALDSSWQTEFETAVNDWEESQVLSLSMRPVGVDRACTQVRGVMKVCNGNYGDTGWVGINEVMMESQNNGPLWIISSVAKMNEYYLLNADYERRQYTMCHEIGHGFGLPHTDEDPNNADLGNCLDYTNRPENNMHPGEENFQRLEHIYLRNDDDDATENNNNRGGGRIRRVLHTYYLWNDEEKRN